MYWALCEAIILKFKLLEVCIPFLNNNTILDIFANLNWFTLDLKQTFTADLIQILV